MFFVPCGSPRGTRRDVAEWFVYYSNQPEEMLPMAYTYQGSRVKLIWVSVYLSARCCSGCIGKGVIYV